MCSGNHDIEYSEDEDWLLKIPNIYSDNSSKTIDGIKFACLPYLAPDFLEFYDCDVLLYHIPPSNTKTAIHRETKEDWGDKELYRIIKNGLISPKIVLSGHMHYPTARIDKINQTTIYNTGVDKNSDVPNYHILNI